MIEYIEFDTEAMALSVMVSQDLMVVELAYDSLRQDGRGMGVVFASAPDRFAAPRTGCACDTQYTVHYLFSSSTLERDRSRGLGPRWIAVWMPSQSILGIV